MRRRFRQLMAWARQPASKGASDGLTKVVASLLGFTALGLGVGVVLLVQVATGWAGDPFCDVRVVKAICSDDADMPVGPAEQLPVTSTSPEVTPAPETATVTQAATFTPTPTPTVTPTPSPTPVPAPSVATTFFGVTGGGPNQAPVIKALFQTRTSETLLVSSVVFEVEALPITLESCSVFAGPVPTFKDPVEVSAGPPGHPSTTEAAVSLAIEPGDPGFEHEWLLVAANSAKSVPPILLVHVTLLVPDIEQPVEVGWAVLMFAEIGGACRTFDATAYDRLQQMLTDRGVPETVRIADIVKDKLGP